MTALDPQWHESTDPHLLVEKVGKRTTAMKAIVGGVLAVFLAGAAVSAWLSLFETRSHADQVATAIRADMEKSKVDCDKRLRAVEEWRKASDERDGWIMRSLDAIGRKLEAPITPPPLPVLDGLKP